MPTYDIRNIKTGEVSVSTGSDFLVIKQATLDSENSTKPTDIIKTIRTRLGTINTQIYELYNLFQKIRDRNKE